MIKSFSIEFSDGVSVGFEDGMLTFSKESKDGRPIGTPFSSSIRIPDYFLDQFNRLRVPPGVNMTVSGSDLQDYNGTRKILEELGFELKYKNGIGTWRLGYYLVEIGSEGGTRGMDDGTTIRNLIRCTHQELRSWLRNHNFFYTSEAIHTSGDIERMLDRRGFRRLDHERWNLGHVHAHIHESNETVESTDSNGKTRGRQTYAEFGAWLFMNFPRTYYQQMDVCGSINNVSGAVCTRPKNHAYAHNNGERFLTRTEMEQELSNIGFKQVRSTDPQKRSEWELGDHWVGITDSGAIWTSKKQYLPLQRGSYDELRNWLLREELKYEQQGYLKTLEESR